MPAHKTTLCLYAKPAVDVPVLISAAIWIVINLKQLPGLAQAGMQDNAGVDLPGRSFNGDAHACVGALEFEFPVSEASMGLPALAEAVTVCREDNRIIDVRAGYRPYQAWLLDCSHTCPGSEVSAPELAAIDGISGGHGRRSG